MQAADPHKLSTCPLCQRDAPYALWHNTHLRVIRVDDPGCPGYTRIIWHAHVAEMTQLAANLREHLMAAVWLVEQTQRHVLQPDKINLASLGNQVAHLHWHIIPRWCSDPYFPGSIWGPAAQDPMRSARWADHARDITARLADYDAALQTALDTLPGLAQPAL